jgi:predicted MPP superfamily phosphohydrolase
MPHHLNLWPDLFLLVVSLSLLSVIFYWTLQSPRCRSIKARLLLIAGCLAITGVEVTGYLLSFARTWRFIPSAAATWVQATGLTLATFLVGLFFAMLVWRSLPNFRSPRRQFLRTAAGTTLAAAPLIGAGFGFLVRNDFRLVEIKVHIPNLAKDLQGLRLVQVTDIHLSPFLSERQFERAIDMANETRADIVLVTGDLITRGGDPLDACLRQLARLRGNVKLGCLGNHEIYTNTEDYVTREGRKIGIDFLRGEARSLRFGGAYINFAGVDYQQFHRPYLVGAEKYVAPGQLNVMLSHNPDVFPVAAHQGYDLTISGHTHGGQVNFEILHKNVDIALAFTPYARGLYQQGNASIYVSSGIGTIGVPVRVGAPPEVSLIQLCAS